jgi:hypothetical protein
MQTEDDLYDQAEAYYEYDAAANREFKELFKKLREEGLSEERFRVLARISVTLSDLFNAAIVGFVARSRLGEAQRIAASDGESRKKIGQILEAIGEGNAAKTRNRQILEWWDALGQMDTEHPGVLCDPLELADPKSELVFPAGSGRFYADQEIQLGFEGLPLDHFGALVSALDLPSDEALWLRLDRERGRAVAAGDPLGNVWIPKLETILSANPKRKDSFPPEILERAAKRSKVDHS